MPPFSLCPICNRPAPPRPSNRSYPFCSERCRLIDLSKWLGEEYRIAGEQAGEGEGSFGPRKEEDDDA
ncbi:MAG TPA: DNA gyrase inhibitor YacG [Anaeromyxobacter sp.]|nr:DNA gyrase inhibitor YacG [Anaeromyxobacter sp.]